MRSRLLAGGVAVGAMAAVAACGSSGSSSTATNPFGGGGVSGSGAISASLPGGVSIPTLPGGLPGISGSLTNGGSGLDACTAMSASVASQITGTTMTKISGQTAGTVSTCVYAGTGGGGGGATATIETLPGGISAQAALQAAMSQAASGSSSSAEAISGLGDAALKSVEEHGATVVFAKGSTVVALGAGGSSRDGASIESDLENLARQIEGQL